MARNLLTYLFLTASLLFIPLALTAQAKDSVSTETLVTDTLRTVNDTIETAVKASDALDIDSVYLRQVEESMAQLNPDSSRVAMRRREVPEQATKIEIRKPDPTTATWLALVFPGGGQIYNRKYWKLPIVYGGFVGCLYAYTWNGQMYKDYRQAYLDIMDSDPNTDSYKEFFRPGYDFERNKEYLKDVFKKRKDRYRRWRDLSIFATIGVYALSVIDAYVDAQLSSFDISDDISLSIEPQRFESGNIFMNNDYYGLNLNITF